MVYGADLIRSDPSAFRASSIMSRFQGISCSIVRDTLSRLIWRDILWAIEAEQQTYQVGKEERDVMRTFDIAGTALCTIMAGLSGRKWTRDFSHTISKECNATN
jgi:hypothetical protein